MEACDDQNLMLIEVCPINLFNMKNGKSKQPDDDSSDDDVVVLECDCNIGWEPEFCTTGKQKHISCGL